MDKEVSFGNEIGDEGISYLKFDCWVLFFFRHSNLIGLLNKLSMQVYDLSPFDMNRSRTIDFEKLKSAQIGEDWFFVQIKER